MSELDQDTIEKIAEKLREKESEEIVQNIKKIAETEDGKKILRSVIDSVDNEIQKEALPGFLRRAGQYLKGKADDAVRSLKGLENAAEEAADPVTISDYADVAQDLGKTVGIPAAGLGAAAYGGSHLYDEIAGEGARPGRKQLQNVLEAVPELEQKYSDEEIQRAWGTLTAHGPRIANSDPVTAGKILERLLSYEGVDMQAIDKLLDIESKKRQATKDTITPLTKSSNDNYLYSLIDKIDEIDKENGDVNKEAANKEYNELKEIVAQYDN